MTSTFPDSTHPTQSTGPWNDLAHSQTVPLGLDDLLLSSSNDPTATSEGRRRLAGHAAVSDALRRGLSDSRWTQRNEKRARNTETLRRTIRRGS